MLSKVVRNILLVCGILSSLLYIAMYTFVPLLLAVPIPANHRVGTRSDAARSHANRWRVLGFESPPAVVIPSPYVRVAHATLSRKALWGAVACGCLVECDRPTPGAIRLPKE